MGLRTAWPYPHLGLPSPSGVAIVAVTHMGRQGLAQPKKCSFLVAIPLSTGDPWPVGAGKACCLPGKVTITALFDG